MSSPLFARPRLYNRDGTRNVFCSRCHHLIGVSNAQSGYNFGSAICAICDAAERGEILSPETIAQLRVARDPSSGYLLPEFMLNDAKKQEEARKEDPMGNEPEDQLSSGSWFKSFAITAVKTIKERLTKTPGSQKLANEKKRQRVFDRTIEDMVDEEDKDQ